MLYFKHMSNMRHDIKIKRLINKYGMEGYGLYNLILESITEKLTAQSPLPNLEETCEDMAMMYKGDTSKINEMATYMLNQGLFDLDEVTGHMLCAKIYKFLDTSQTRSQEIKTMIKAFKDSQNGLIALNNDVSQTVSDCHGDSIVEDSIVEDSIDIEYPIHKTFTLNWFKRFNKIGGNQIIPSDADYQKAFIACNKLGNDESILAYAINDYWDNYTYVWYYKNSNRHIFSSFCSNIECHLPKGETQEERAAREKKEEAKRRREIERYNDEFMMGKMEVKEYDEDGELDYSSLKNRFN